MRSISRKLSLIFLLIVSITASCRAESKDSTGNKGFHFEVSFGQSVLFISNSDQIQLHNSNDITLPTSSILLFSELRTNKKIRIPVFFNLPTESKSFLVNGQLVYEKASPTIGTGLQFKLFSFNVLKLAKIEAEVGPLAGVVLDGKNTMVAPLLAGRIKVMRGEYFVLYLGTTYTFGLNTMGLFYGTGSGF